MAGYRGVGSGGGGQGENEQEKLNMYLFLVDNPKVFLEGVNNTWTPSWSLLPCPQHTGQPPLAPPTTHRPAPPDPSPPNTLVNLP